MSDISVTSCSDQTQEKVKNGKILEVNRKAKCPQNVGTDDSNDSQKLSRKRKRHPETWNMNINKILCQSGKEYRDVKGNVRKERTLKTLKNCEKLCKYLCAKKISTAEREQIFKGFWTLSNDLKLHFYSKNTERIIKVRKQTSKNESRRNYSYKYYFHVADEKFRVCKTFFLSTLDISQQRINYFHEKKKDSLTGIPAVSQQGCHPKKTISTASKDYVRLHISQLPRVESHYCRIDTKKEYLEGTMNLNRLYLLYTEFCIEKQIEPVKIHIYRNIFNTEFNIEFLKPKKDRCDVCEEYRLRKNNINDNERDTFERHLHGKQTSKENRDLDRRNEDAQTAIVSFDLENVFALPRSNISSFFLQ